MLFSCSNIKEYDLFVKRINSSTPQPISTQADDSTIYFTDDFWNYLVTRFESGSVELIAISSLPYPKSFVADTSFHFGVIDSTNRTKLLRYFPRDLSKTEHANYIEEQTMRMPKDDPDFEAAISKPEWQKAPPAIEKEYRRFYDLIGDKRNDYILFIKNPAYKRLITHLRAPRPTERL